MNRRTFFKRTLATASTLPFMGLFGLSSPLGAAEINDEFKALVCVVLHGGPDTFNMIVPTDEAPYLVYESLRNDIAVPKEELLGFSHLNQHGLNQQNYGFRPEMSGIQNLFESSELAIIGNVGTLQKPTTKNDALNKLDLPNQLFAHDAQRIQWEFANSQTSQTEGFGGKLVNLMFPKGSPYFHISTDKNSALQHGSIEQPLVIRNTENSIPSIEGEGFGVESGDARLGSSYKYILGDNALVTNKLKNYFVKKRLAEIKRDEALQGIFDSKTTLGGFEDTPIGNQLKTVAEILSVKDYFPNNERRKMFTVTMGGWDTHDKDNHQLSQELSDAFLAFSQAMNQLNLSMNVTTFTISEFGRKTTSNGSGTDHGWGSQAFVMGGAVKGRDIYGKMPDLSSGSDDVWSSRVIPTTSVEEYLEPILKWYGIADAEMTDILPNLESFDRNYMNFMNL